ncbi:hypothetical protein LMJF_27_0280 [Leishmania major strain Friedlin]|uniref:Uncharacterized protein n=1 Tax=Leishmania major TaxID=5664 RepID=E9AD05_LEIMA|nr:hypothetical protein LMJF_27_0280 [Leishmania major strain Friedlin]CAG9576628.1 hypothetical_protein_unknown_function [Leishmania major strain Friedlin]CBZ12088.1 hypothetical protein LMJF_27_0280 [Leishmania major strain Friedlin]|eukprot:XP_003721834.1 hypothetical protein LMJF_27_0280 [Leishmania major strain Friedlin]
MDIISFPVRSAKPQSLFRLYVWRASNEVLIDVVNMFALLRKEHLACYSLLEIDYSAYILFSFQLYNLLYSFASLTTQHSRSIAFSHLKE